MSKTFRRKHYETETVSFRGLNKFGYYTEYDLIDGAQSPRPMTPEEYFDAWYWAHGDCGSKRRFGPDKYLKKRFNRKNKWNYKRQFHLWLRNPDYEVVDQTLATWARWEN
jgi:hypothetical protein